MSCLSYLDTCNFQNLFKTACSILSLSPSSFFYSCVFAEVQVVHTYSSIVSAAALKKSCFFFIGEIRFLYDQWPINCSPHLRSVYVDIVFSRWDVAVMVCELVYLFQRLVFERVNGSCLKRLYCFYLYSCRPPDNAAEIQLGQVYLQEVLDHLRCLHLS